MESKKDEDKEVVMISCVESTELREYCVFSGIQYGCWTKYRGILHTPKMDGENNGKPYEQIHDLGVPLFSETSICCM